MESRVVWLDSLKGVLIILVILGHSIAQIIGNDAANNNYLWCLIYSFHMPAFISVSGYLAYDHMGGGKLNVLFSVIRRFQQLLLPFFIWSLAFLAIRDKIALYVNCIFMPNTTFWFLWALFFISALFIIVQYFSQKCKVNNDHVLVATCVVFAGVLVLLKDIHFLGIQYILYYFIFYVLGYFIHKWNLRSNKVNVRLLFVIWLFLASFWRPNALPDFSPLTGSVATMLCFVHKFVVAAVAVVTLFLFAPRVLNNDHIINRVLAWLGKFSLGIYVIHLTFIDIAMSVVARFINGEIARVWLLCFLLLLFSVALIRILNINKWTARLLLGKI